MRMPGSCGRSSSPQLTGYLRDRRAGGALLGTAKVLDEARAAHLARARESVRAYIAAAHSGRASEAWQFLDAFPVPARALSISGAAAAWRESSATAQDAVRGLAAQRAATTAEVSAGPELLHAATCYLAAREGQLHLVRDALGRLAFPVPVPRDLPEVLAPVAPPRPVAASSRLRHSGARATSSGSPCPSIAALPQAPRATCSAALWAHWSASGPPALSSARRTSAPACKEVMTRPAAPAAAAPAPPTGHDAAHAHAQALAFGMDRGPGS